MLTYVVTAWSATPPHDPIMVRGNSFEVDPNGGLIIYSDGQPVAAFQSGRWATVTTIDGSAATR